MTDYEDDEAAMNGATLFGQSNGATFSQDLRYRYRLWREWGDVTRRMVVISLNPSTADETHDDPTVRKDIGFAKRWGFGALDKLNLFAWRSTDSRGLLGQDDPVGAGNDMAIMRALSTASRVVLAWGRHDHLKAILPARVAVVRAIVQEYARCEVGTIGKPNSDGSPKHPLYISYVTEFRPVTFSF